MKTTTKRTLDALRKQGYTAQVVERWCSFSKRRVDLFGCIDVVAVSEKGTLGVQATVRGEISKRVRKIVEECHEAAKQWLMAGNRLSVWGWQKMGPKGKRQVWTLKEREITTADFDHSTDSEGSAAEGEG